jgi:hypothetical protein
MVHSPQTFISSQSAGHCPQTIEAIDSGALPEAIAFAGLNLVSNILLFYWDWAGPEIKLRVTRATPAKIKRA